MVELAINYKTYRYKKVTTTALNSINYTFEDKGLYLICGESGCGKTTLLNCIGGLDSFKGTIKIDQNEYKNLVSYKERISNISYIFQDLVLKEDLTVYENIKLFKKEVDDNEIIDCLKEVGIEKLINRKISTLSGGQKQRVGIARCFYLKPKIVLADEPTAFLDEENKNIILQLLKKLSNSSLVILVSHEKEIAKNYADYLLTMADGHFIRNEKLDNTDIEYKLKKEDNEQIDNLLTPNKNDNVKFKSLFKKSKVNVISIIGYIITGIALSFLFLFVNLISIANNKDNFVCGYENEVIIRKSEGNNIALNKKEIEEIQTFNGIDYISPLYNSVAYHVNFASINQQFSEFDKYNYTIRGSYINDKLQGDIIYGRKSENISEVVIDEFMAKTIISNYFESITDSTRKVLGINSIQNLINGQIYLYNDATVKIVGIAKGNSYCIYCKEELINLIALKQCDFYQDYNITYIKELVGENELADNEILLDKHSYEQYARDTILVKDKIYNIKGYFESDYYKGIIASKSEVESLVFNHAIVGKSELSVIASNVEELLNTKNPKYGIITLFSLTKQTVQHSNKSSSVLITIFAIIIFSICVITIFIVKRNELLKNSEMYFFDLLYARSKFYVFCKYLYNNALSVILTAIPAFIISLATLNFILDTMGTLFLYSLMPTYFFFLGILILFLFYIFISFITFFSLFKGTIIKYKTNINKEN